MLHVNLRYFMGLGKLAHTFRNYRQFMCNPSTNSQSYFLPLLGTISGPQQMTHCPRTSLEPLQCWWFASATSVPYSVHNQSRASEALVAQNGWPTSWDLMDSHMAGPMCVKLSGVVGGCQVSVLGQRNISNWKKNLIFFCLLPNSIWSLHVWRLSRLWGLSPSDTST